MSGIDSDQRRRLESERDFLLRSLDDLESEHAAGTVDDESYGRLRDDYTARAAAAIRALRDGADAASATPDRSKRVRRLTIGLIIAFVLLTGSALWWWLGDRQPGQTSTGNSQANALSPTKAAEARRKQLEAAITSNPNDTASRLLLAQELEADNDLAGALKQYDAVIQIMPTSADAYAQSGRILYITAGQVKDGTQAATLVDEAKTRLDHSIELDPSFADARFFRAIVLANEYQDFRGAQGDLQRYLLAQPTGQFSAQARQLLADVTNALNGTPVNPTTTSTTRK